MDSEQNTPSNESTPNFSSVKSTIQYFLDRGAKLGNKKGSILMPSPNKQEAATSSLPVEERKIQNLMKRKGLSREQAEAALNNPA